MYSAPSVAAPAEKSVLDRALDTGESIAWGLIDRYAPELAPIVRQGPIEWLTDKVSSAFNAAVDTLLAPIRTVSGVVDSISGHFTNVLAWIREAVTQISSVSGPVFRSALDKVEKVFGAFSDKVVARASSLFDTIKQFANGLIDRFALPAWEFIKRYAGAAWDRITEMAGWLWDKTEPLRGTISAGWNWLKAKLGIGGGAGGKEGILQWVQKKAEQLWEGKVKPFLDKYKKPLLMVAGILVYFSPVGPILTVMAGATGLIAGISWIKQQMATRDGVAKARVHFQKVIIPGIMKAVNGVVGSLTGVIANISAQLGKLVDGIERTAAAFAGTFIEFVAGLVRWVGEHLRTFVSWVNIGLTNVADLIKTALTKFSTFIEPILNTLIQVGQVVTDIFKLPGLVLGSLWKMVPAWIREPLTDFLLNQVLKRIPIFNQVIELLPKIWARISNTAMVVIQKIFKDGDLAAAALEVLQLLLDALEVPVDLVKQIFAKGKALIGMIVKDPVGFLINMLKTLKEGFFLFGKNIFTHLLSGFVNWLFAAVTKAGISVPQKFDLQSIFGFVLEVLGITLDKILTKLDKKLGRDRMAKIRKVLTGIAKVWGWLGDLFEDGVAGVWGRIKDKAGDLWKALLDGAIGWMIEKITTVALQKLATFLAPSGIGAVVNGLIAIYNAIQSFIQYLKQILEIINSVLDTGTDIAKGAIAGAAALFEKTLVRALPIVIGFLANQVGLGDISKKIKDIVGVIQGKVDIAIDWVIEKAIAGGEKLLRAIGVKAEPSAPRPESSDGDWIAEIPAEGGHTFKVRKDLEVFKFSKAGDKQTGKAKQEILQKVIEKQVKPGDSIKYGEYDSDGRQTAAEGYVSHKGDRPRLTMLRIKGAGGYEPGDERGHLIGDRWNGEPIVRNLVPLSEAANRGSGSMETEDRHLEKEYSRLSKEKNLAVLLYLRITPKYEDSRYNMFRPTAIEMHSELSTLVEGAEAATVKPSIRTVFIANRSENQYNSLKINILRRSEIGWAMKWGFSAPFLEFLIAERDAGGNYKGYDDLKRRTFGDSTTEARLQRGGNSNLARLKYEQDKFLLLDLEIREVLEYVVAKGK